MACPSGSIDSKARRPPSATGRTDTGDGRPTGTSGQDRHNHIYQGPDDRCRPATSPQDPCDGPHRFATGCSPRRLTSAVSSPLSYVAMADAETTEDRYIALLQRAGDTESFKAGETIFAEGDRADRVYMVKAGTV